MNESFYEGVSFYIGVGELYNVCGDEDDNR